MNACSAAHGKGKAAFGSRHNCFSTSGCERFQYPRDLAPRLRCGHLRTRHRASRAHPKSHKVGATKSKSKFDSEDDQAHSNSSPGDTSSPGDVVEVVQTTMVTLAFIVAVILFNHGIEGLLDHFLGESVPGAWSCVFCGLATVFWIRLSGLKVASLFLLNGDIDYRNANR
jgi:hypothetical protein